MSKIQQSSFFHAEVSQKFRIAPTTKQSAFYLNVLTRRKKSLLKIFEASVAWTITKSRNQY